MTNPDEDIRSKDQDNGDQKDVKVPAEITIPDVIESPEEDNAPEEITIPDVIESPEEDNAPEEITIPDVIENPEEVNTPEEAMILDVTEDSEEVNNAPDETVILDVTEAPEEANIHDETMRLDVTEAPEEANVPEEITTPDEIEGQQEDKIPEEITIPAEMEAPKGVDIPDGITIPDEMKEQNEAEPDQIDEDFSLDDSAEQLYKQFSGIDDADYAIADDSPNQSELMAILKEEEKMLDYYRLLLAQAVCLFAEILTNSRFSSLSEENTQKITSFINLLKKMEKAPKYDGMISCRLRGLQRPEETGGETDNGETIGDTDTYDYELSLGNLLLDHQGAKNVEQREKFKGEAIYAKLMQSFKALSILKIFNFSIETGEGSDDDYLRIENTIKHLGQFYNNESDKSAYFVKDEYGHNNINLTLLSSTNNVQAAALQNLVNKIKEKMFGKDPAPELNIFTTVYDVILASRRYREQLRKMPIELNNMQRLMQNMRPDRKITKEGIQVSRLVLAKYGSNPRMASEVISSINSEGYTKIKTEVMGKRLSLATGFLKLTEEVEQKEGMQNEALQNIEEGLNQVSDEVYDKIAVEGGEVSTVDEKGEKTSWSLHEKLHGMVSFFKQRSQTKKKVRDIANKDVHFNAEDFSVIARNFKITELEASHLIDLLKNCFSDNGRFRRNFFEVNIPHFLKYESKVFEFLWHYLKELPLRQDRVAFLNALQILVAKLDEPQDALKILLVDIFNRSSALSFSDRNGLMLGNILLRNFNREENSNIELSPEEVLLVRQGLNLAMVDVVLEFFAEHQEMVMRKVRRINEVLTRASIKAQYEKDEMQP